MASKRFTVVIFLILHVCKPTLALSTEANEVLKNWVDITTTPIGNFSIRAIEGGNNYKSSLLKDEKGEYKWFMRVDYKKPKGKVAYTITKGYFNCNSSEVFIDQQIEYDKRGIVRTC